MLTTKQVQEVITLLCELRNNSKNNSIQNTQEYCDGKFLAYDHAAKILRFKLSEHYDLEQAENTLRLQENKIRKNQEIPYCNWCKQHHCELAECDKSRSNSNA